MLEEILQHWPIDEVVSINKVETGLLNQTFIIHTRTNMYVLQQLHLAVSAPGCTENYFHVTQFLLRQGKTSQRLITTKDNDLRINYKNSFWRLLEAVPGDVYTTTPNLHIATEAGRLLADFHVSLKNFSRDLAPTLPMFQYNQVLAKFNRYETKLKDDANEKVHYAYRAISEYFYRLLLPPDLPETIIHTDPKISNFLFEDNQGICMIDLDTVQKLSPLYDIGDCIRSICGKEEDDPNNSFNIEYYQAILDGYMKTNHEFSQREKDLVPQACQLIMLGLATRFLNDYIEDSYFGWNPKKYKSRKEHNLARCLGQIALWESFVSQIKN